MRLATAALVTALAAGAAAQQDPPPPNVVLILVDDLGWMDLGCQGSHDYETPNIDALATGGVRFTDAYASCAVCSPSRAAILTGREPARLGLTDWIRARFQRGSEKASPSDAYVGGKDRALLCPPNPFELELDEVTLAEMLRPAGYAACHVGKWHLGDDACYPEHQGFDENHGGCDYGQPPSYFDPYRNDRLPAGIPTLPPRRAGEYLTDREADEAVAFVRKNAARPFFLYYAPYAVHAPIQGKPELVRTYRARKLRQGSAAYAAMVHSVDQAVGRIAAALDDAGLGERTLVLFTSDNGGLSGPTDNAPLRAGKGWPYEGGIRVPMIARWPGTIPEGVVSDLPVQSIDCVPTILAATGVTAPPDHEIDGVSLYRHLVTGGRERPPRKSLFWHFPHYRQGLRIRPYSIVRAGALKLIRHWEGPRFELFDLAADPGETHDLARQRLDDVRRFDDLLLDHLRAAGARLPRPDPSFAGPVAATGDRLPRVLLLGDSISIGYTPLVQRALRGEAQVLRPARPDGRAENCAGTTRGVQQVERWLQLYGGDFDVIHFNFGLHDLKRVHPDTGRPSNDPDDPRQADPERYEQQLRAIVAALKRTGAELVCATTTPVPTGNVHPHRDAADVERYNAIARRVMAANDIAIDDLNAVVESRLAELQRPVNVHFTHKGYQVLAEAVADHLRAALRRRK